MEIIFWCGTKCLGLAQNVYKFLVRPKKFGPAQNVLGPVEGRGIRVQSEYRASKKYWNRRPLKFLIDTKWILNDPMVHQTN